MEQPDRRGAAVLEPEVETPWPVHVVDDSPDTAGAGYPTPGTTDHRAIEP